MDGLFNSTHYNGCNYQPMLGSKLIHVNEMGPWDIGHTNYEQTVMLHKIWAPSQYPKRRLFVRSRKVSKPRDWYFKLSYRFEIWQAHRQHCCRSACQISERSDKSKYKSRGFETLRDLTERRLFGYWDGAQVPIYDLYDPSQIDKSSDMSGFLKITQHVKPRPEIRHLFCRNIMHQAICFE